MMFENPLYFYCKLCDIEWKKEELKSNARCPSCLKFVSWKSKESISSNNFIELMTKLKVAKGEATINDLAIILLNK